MAVTCGIFHYLAPGAPCCLCLCTVLLFFPPLPSLCGIILRQPVASWGLLFVVGPAVWDSSNCQLLISPLHGLSSPRLYQLLHCGYHPAQDQPLQPGRTSLLPMGEEHVWKEVLCMVKRKLLRFLSVTDSWVFTVCEFVFFPFNLILSATAYPCAFSTVWMNNRKND